MDRKLTHRNADARGKHTDSHKSPKCIRPRRGAVELRHDYMRTLKDIVRLEHATSVQTAGPIARITKARLEYLKGVRDVMKAALTAFNEKGAAHA